MSVPVGSGGCLAGCMQFITGFGLEFYPLGGDPKVLSEYVVKHRGILPGWDISEAVQQREQVRQILYSTYGACTLPDPLHPDKPMTADAIVANPPAYGHTHCAEKLNVPLHIVFTMPWTPTKVFPQPFARIDVDMKRTNSKAREVMNWLSYFAMEDLAWVGMAGMQKDFRCNVLGLKTWNKLTTSHSIYHSKVPITYIWSPSLVPRPTDWPSHCE
ncbi:glyco_transf_28 domain-containing protein, partial [Haematococcus lacustris]